MDGTLLRYGDDCVVRFERHLAHPVEKVWRAITEQDELRQWFPDGGLEIDLTLGGKVRFAAEGWEGDPDLMPSDGTITRLDPPRLLEFTWGDDPLRFELSAEGDGCILVFTQTFAGRAAAPRLAAGWTICLGNLDAALAGRTPSPLEWPTLYERYIDELGSDGTFVRDGDIAVLRFERVLERPAQDVWDAITTPARLVHGAVTRADAPKVLEHTWTSPGEPDGEVKWQLIPAGDRCILLFTHTVHGHWDAAGTMAAWHVHLALLRTSLAGRPTGPFPEARWEELRASYRAMTG